MTVNDFQPGPGGHRAVGEFTGQIQHPRPRAAATTGGADAPRSPTGLNAVIRAP